MPSLEIENINLKDDSATEQMLQGNVIPVNKKNIQKRGFFPAINGLIPIMLYGFSLTTIPIYGFEIISKLIPAFFICALLSNWIFTYFDMNPTYQLIICNFLFACSTIVQLICSFAYSGSHEGIFRILAFAIIGGASGGVMHAAPGYIATVAPENYIGIFMACIAGVGIVGGLILGNNIQYFSSTVLACNTTMLIVSIIEMVILLFLKSYTSNHVSKKLTCEKLKEMFVKFSSCMIFVAGLHIAAQLSGINYLVFHFTEIFGIEKKIFYFNIIYFIGSVTTIVSAYIANRFKRLNTKTMYITSALIVLIASVCAFFGVPLIVWAFLLIVGFNTGMGNVPFSIVTEIFTMDMINEASCFSNTMSWAGGIIFSFIPINGAAYFNPIFAISGLGCIGALLLFIFKYNKLKDMVSSSINMV